MRSRCPRAEVSGGPDGGQQPGAGHGVRVPGPLDPLPDQRRTGGRGAAGAARADPLPPGGPGPGRCPPSTLAPRPPPALGAGSRHGARRPLPPALRPPRRAAGKGLG